MATGAPLPTRPGLSRVLCAALATGIALQSIPVGTTKIEVTEGGGFHVASLSRRRYIARQAISALRLCIAAFLTYQGTQFLVYTIAIEELLLKL